MKNPMGKPTVKLIDTEGNAFSIMGRVKNALARDEADREQVDKYLKKAIFEDYDNLLCVTMDYVDVT